ncbi:hypothetical protein JCM11491_006768 [Sporobolomyces phaffii]
MSVCFDSSGIPVPCTGWTVYDSYVTDPRYQRYLTVAWTSAFALVFLFTLPSIVKFVGRGQVGLTFGNWRGLFGIYDDSTTSGYERVQDDAPAPSVTITPRRKPSRAQKPFLAISALFHSLTRSCPRIPFVRTRYSSMSTGHLLALVLVPALLLATLFPESQLAENPNRFGFLALACIPPLFVLSSKNGAVNFFLGRSWTAVNFLHRWLGRAVLLLVVCHFALWSVQWARAGELAEFLSSSKERRGLGAFAFLLLITVSSLPQFRRFSYPVFFTLHYVSIIGFLVFLNQHTIYARGWATWSVVGIYAVDIAGRLASVRVRWVEVEALEGGMTKVGMRGVTGGWTGGQTIDLRLFFVPPLGGEFDDPEEPRGRLKTWAETFYRAIKSAVRPFESHPFSIATAPPARSVGTLTSTRGRRDHDRGVELFVKSCGPGTWSDDLYRFASLASSSSASYEPISRDSPTQPRERPSPRMVPVLALFFGPYASGLPTYSSPAVLEDRETVSLFAGGSGMSFVMGVLEELVGRRTRQGRGGHVEVVWVVREPAHVSWFLPRLETLLSSIPPAGPLSVSLDIHVTARAPNRSLSSSTLPPRTTLSFASRPRVASVLADAVSRAVSPCAHCYPVCRCGDSNATGTCANGEEECVGSGDRTGTELLFDSRGRPSAAAAASDDDEIHAVSEADKFEASPCGCARPQSSTEKAGSVGEEKPQKGCCSTAVGSQQQKGCCGSRYPPPTTTGGGVTEAPTPLRVRSGGMAVIVCGPRSMTGELRNAVAGIPIAHQVRIGGVDLHVEQFGL